MRVYIAGTHGTIDHEKKINTICSKRLLSFYSINVKEFGVDKVFNLIKNTNENLLSRNLRNFK